MEVTAGAVSQVGRARPAGVRSEIVPSNTGSNSANAVRVQIACERIWILGLAAGAEGGG